METITKNNKDNNNMKQKNNGETIDSTTSETLWKETSIGLPIRASAFYRVPVFTLATSKLTIALVCKPTISLNWRSYWTDNQFNEVPNIW